MFYLFLHKNMHNWRDLGISMVSTFSMALGKQKFSEMAETNIIAAYIYFLFSVVVSIILINILLTIIIRAFVQVGLIANKRIRDFMHVLGET